MEPQTTARSIIEDLVQKSYLGASAKKLRNPYYLGLCSGGKSYSLYMKVEQPTLKSPSGDIAGGCDGASALTLGYNKLWLGKTGVGGSSSGTFEPPSTVTLPTFAATTYTRDLNNDGNPDIIALGESMYFGESVQVLLNKGSGFMAPAPLPPNTFIAPVSAAIGDVTSDGIVDLVILDATTSNPLLMTYQGVGDGNFTHLASSPLGFSGSLSDIQAIDLTKNGSLSIVGIGCPTVGCSTGKAIYIYSYNSGGTLSLNSTIPNVTGYTNLINTGDLNADGYDDIITAGCGVKVLINNKTGGFHSPVSYPHNSCPITSTTGDINNDGFIDVIAGTYNTPDAKNIAYYLGRGDGTLGLVKYVTNTPSTFRIAIEDVNADGIKDIITSRYGYDNYLVDGGSPWTSGIDTYFGDTTLTYANRVHIGEGTSYGRVSSVDTNNDGVLDIVAGVLGSSVAVFRGKK